MNKNSNNDSTANLLKELTIQDFLDVGVNQVAYIKKSPNSSLKQESFSIYAADGSQISVMDSYDMAIAAVRVNDLYPATLH